jgi:hypothetical protein
MKGRHGTTFAEYLVIVGLASAVLVMINNYLRLSLNGGIKSLTDQYIGQGSQSGFSPYMLEGGKQLVDQSGVYTIEGDTGKQINISETNELYPDGSRKLSWDEAEYRSSPGNTGPVSGISSLPDYVVQDQGKPPVYVPPFVGANEGFVQPPTRNQLGTVPIPSL